MSTIIEIDCIAAQHLHALPPLDDKPMDLMQEAGNLFSLMERQGLLWAHKEALPAIGQVQKAMRQHLSLLKFCRDNLLQEAYSLGRELNVEKAIHEETMVKLDFANKKIKELQDQLDAALHGQAHAEDLEEELQQELLKTETKLQVKTEELATTSEVARRMRICALRLRRQHLRSIKVIGGLRRRLRDSKAKLEAKEAQLEASITNGLAAALHAHQADLGRTTAVAAAARATEDARITKLALTNANRLVHQLRQRLQAAASTAVPFAGNHHQSSPGYLATPSTWSGAGAIPLPVYHLSSPGSVNVCPCPAPLPLSPARRHERRITSVTCAQPPIPPSTTVHTQPSIPCPTSGWLELTGCQDTCRRHTRLFI